MPVGADPPPLPTPTPDSPPDPAAAPKPSASSPEEKAAAGGASPLLVSTHPFPKKTHFGWGNTSAATISALEDELLEEEPLLLPHPYQAPPSRTLEGQQGERRWCDSCAVSCRT